MTKYFMDFKNFYIEQELQQDLLSNIKKAGQPDVVSNLLQSKLKQYNPTSIDDLIFKLEQEPKVKEFVNVYKMSKEKLQESLLGDIAGGIKHSIASVAKWFLNSVFDTVKHILGPIFGMGGASTASKFKYVTMLLLTLGLPLSMYGLLSAAGASSAVPIGVKAYGASWALIVWFGDTFLQPLLAKAEGVPPEARFI